MEIVRKVARAYGRTLGCVVGFIDAWRVDRYMRRVERNIEKNLHLCSDRTREKFAQAKARWDKATPEERRALYDRLKCIP